MTTIDQFKDMAEQLRLYDVVDGGWEGDPQGEVGSRSVEQNLTHVIFHLSDVIDRKDFNDERQVKKEIAPDALQYALRLARWSGLSLEDTAYPTGELLFETERLSDRLGLDAGFPGDSHPEAAHIKATAEIGRGLHETDHRATAEAGRLALPRRLGGAASLLSYTAQELADCYDFDIQVAFEKRLAELRERFGILRRTKD